MTRADRMRCTPLPASARARSASPSFLESRTAPRRGPPESLRKSWNPVSTGLETGGVEMVVKRRVPYESSSMAKSAPSAAAMAAINLAGTESRRSQESGSWRAIGISRIREPQKRAHLTEAGSAECLMNLELYFDFRRQFRGVAVGSIHPSQFSRPRTLSTS